MITSNAYTQRNILRVLQAARELIACGAEKMICFAVMRANVNLGEPLTFPDLIRLRSRVMSVLEGCPCFENWYFYQNRPLTLKQVRQARIRWLDQWIAAIQAAPVAPDHPVRTHVDWA